MNNNINYKQINNTIHNKRAFTLVEITIVLLLVSILSVMTVTFSNLVSSYVSDNKIEYDFYEQYGYIRNEIIEEVSKLDCDTTQFLINNSNYSLIIKKGDVTDNILFLNNELLLNSDKLNTMTLSEISNITFLINNKLIKCTVTSKTKQKLSFLIAIRCGGTTNE